MTHKCPACLQSEKLGLNDEQNELFHKLVDAELSVSNAMNDLEESGVDLEAGVEDALIAAVDGIFADSEQRTIN